MKRIIPAILYAAIALNPLSALRDVGDIQENPLGRALAAVSPIVCLSLAVTLPLEIVGRQFGAQQANRAGDSAPVAPASSQGGKHPAGPHIIPGSLPDASREKTVEFAAIPNIEIILACELAAAMPAQAGSSKPVLPSVFLLFVVLLSLASLPGKLLQEITAQVIRPAAPPGWVFYLDTRSNEPLAILEALHSNILSINPAIFNLQIEQWSDARVAGFPKTGSALAGCAFVIRRSRIAADTLRSSFLGSLRNCTAKIAKCSLLSVSGMQSC